MEPQQDDKLRECLVEAFENLADNEKSVTEAYTNGNDDEYTEECQENPNE